MIFLYLILLWFAIFIGYLLYLRIRDNVRNGRFFFDFGKSNFLLASFLVFGLAALIVNVTRYEPQFSSPDEQIEYGIETNQPWVSNAALWKKTEANPYSIDDHFQLVRNHYAQLNPSTPAPDVAAYNAEEERMFTTYDELSRSADSKLHDIGHIMLADMWLSQPVPDYTEASAHLRSVDDPTTKYVNYHAARIMIFGAGSSLAEEHLYSEIRNKGYKKGAYEYLALLYEAERRDTALRSIVYSGAETHIAPEIRARIYFEDHDLLRFYSVKLQTLLGGITAWGLSGGIAILFVWMYVLLAFGRVSEIRLRHLLLPLLGGAMASMLAWWLYAYYRYALGFSLDGNIANDLGFAVTGIGFIEELVKLIPFLLILWFTKTIRKPVDYMIVASACGLGFAVFENLMYISGYGLDVIHSRALTSSVAHMACSGIVAYGFVLCRYRWKKQYWLIPLFFILAAGAHGFYDFWLVNEKVKALGIITLFFYLSLILVYISFVGNALNQSVQEGEAALMSAFDALRTTSVFAGAMILLFAFEYVATSIVYGTHYGNAAMLKAFLAGGYLIFFLSIRLARVRIHPQRWNRIEFLTGLLPGQGMSDKTEPEDAAISSPDEQTSPPEQQ
jgi:RsiW-degrading membrane proteinase PrsW (M82 family)